MTTSRSSAITLTANLRRRKATALFKSGQSWKTPSRPSRDSSGGRTDGHKEDLSASAPENPPRRRGIDFFHGRREEIPLLKCNYTKYVHDAGHSTGNSPLRLRETLSHVLKWNSFRNKQWRSHSLGSPIERTPHCDDASTCTLVQRTRSSTHRYNWEPSDPPCA